MKTLALAVLFVGNSLTYYNEMPWMLEQVAKSKGVTLRAKFVGFSGRTLRQQWEDPRVRQEIAEGHYDFVVLQPQGSEIDRATENTGRYARLLHEEVRKAGARTILFETWSRPPRRQSDYTARFTRVARDLGVTLAPVGTIAARLQAKGYVIVDEVAHPHLAGSYLEACVFFKLVTGRSPVGATHTFDVHFEIPEAYRRYLEEERLDAATAEAIQRAVESNLPDHLHDVRREKGEAEAEMHRDAERPFLRGAVDERPQCDHRRDSKGPLRSGEPRRRKPREPERQHRGDAGDEHDHRLGISGRQPAELREAGHAEDDHQRCQEAHPLQHGHSCRVIASTVTPRSRSSPSRMS